ncbi:MAG TPA: YciI family protein [Candidatus Krumholzibacteria bacterium]|nr:YciI family protein [Candidatus Krumholzibacteria bacterium]
MRFMCIVKATEQSEKGILPTEKEFSDMGKFNEEMARAGVMLSGDGLQPSSKGARVNFTGSQRTVTDGPFAETKELIAGFWMIQVKSKEEAIEWMKRCPNPHPGLDTHIEIRQVYEADDFGDALTPELREREERIRRDIEKKR